MKMSTGLMGTCARNAWPAFVIVMPPPHAPFPDAHLLGEPLATETPSSGEEIQGPVDVRIVEAEHGSELGFIDNLHRSQ